MSGVRWRSVAALCATVLVGAATPPDSPVADAAMRGDATEVLALVQAGADVNAAQGDGMTALHWAAVHGDVAVAQILVSAGASLRAVTRHGAHTPLHIAAREGSGEVVDYLLDEGATPDALTTTGVTPLHHAVLGGSLRAVESLLAHGAAVDTKEGVWDQTPLIFASAFNRVDIMTALLDEGADPNVYTRLVDMDARRDVDRAAQEAYENVLDAFRELQGDQAATWRPSPTEVQAAMQEAHRVQRAAIAARAAVAEEEDPDAEELADGARTQGGMTPLLHAAREGHIEAALLLLDRGADLHRAKLVDDTSPLLMAMINGQYDTGLALLERGANPNQAAVDGVAPLYAVINNFWGAKTRYPQVQYQHYQRASYLETMEELLKAGANPNHRIGESPWYLEYTFGSLGVNFQGATAFFRAAHAVDVPAMRLLVSYGADHTLTTLSAPGGRGGRGGRDGPLPEFIELVPGVYPVHAAAGVSYGQSYTANFHLHAPDGWMPTMRYLVEDLGHDVNVRDASGYTPLHHAAARGDNEMILFLVDHGADVTAVANNGRTTVDMANGPGQRITPIPTTIALLERLGGINNHNCVSC